MWRKNHLKYKTKAWNGEETQYKKEKFWKIESDREKTKKQDVYKIRSEQSETKLDAHISLC